MSNTRRLFLYFLSFIFLTTSALAAWFYILFTAAPISIAKTPITFIVPKGATVAEVADLLVAQGVNQKTYYFLLLAKSLKQLNRIKSGEYQIAADATPQQLIAKLRKGQLLLHKITFPEGWTFQQIMSALAAEPRLDHTLQNAQNVMKAMGHPDDHPEGQFYPDTYFFIRGDKDSKILLLAYQLMQKKLMRAWESRAPDLPYKTPYEALIVASLIEREAVLVSEQPMIAGVILRRLKMGMRLQIDAAVLYGLSTQTHRTLTGTDLSTDTPYNTYTRRGLPPTPIAMPGASAIHAALHPVSGTALYYVAKGDGSHTFSDNLQEHHIATRAYKVQLDMQRTDDQGVILQQCISPELLMNYWQEG